MKSNSIRRLGKYESMSSINIAVVILPWETRHLLLAFHAPVIFNYTRRTTIENISNERVATSAHYSMSLFSFSTADGFNCYKAWAG